MWCNEPHASLIHVSPNQNLAIRTESYLSKKMRTAKMPRASGSADSKWPAFGYSRPGAGSARSAQVTLCGSQKRSFQNQAESAAMLEENWRFRERGGRSERNDSPPPSLSLSSYVSGSLRCVDVLKVFPRPAAMREEVSSDSSSARGGTAITKAQNTQNVSTSLKFSRVTHWFLLEMKLEKVVTVNAQIQLWSRFSEQWFSQSDSRCSL